eukprot:CAMPEP_0194213182 /NCGR_PEP_ID=MMETSP0156-20130528/13563_1 /TAXON_ID=33649 /ORGANISM="Thalassionema nitzschioides, Strain L26-B" /LENGTH=435 /DNA_ID=CAMNT_0038941155 /DNA_START=77 /DNA_END=1384 /DNA_ORIENTATION=-
MHHTINDTTRTSKISSSSSSSRSRSRSSSSSNSNSSSRSSSSSSSSSNGNSSSSSTKKQTIEQFLALNHTSYHTTTTTTWKSDPNTNHLAVVPKEYDVLCGRGKYKTTHYGNQLLQKDMVDRYTDFIRANNRFEKSLLVRDCIQAVLRRGGRFLKKKNNTGDWYVTGYPDARDKVSHALRNMSNVNVDKRKGLLFTQHDDEDDDEAAAAAAAAEEEVSATDTTNTKPQKKKQKIISVHKFHKVNNNNNNNNNNNHYYNYHHTINNNNNNNNHHHHHHNWTKPWDADPTIECIPQPQDVLCGRGKRAYTHPGNQQLQSAIAVQASEFTSCTSRAEKSFLVREVVGHVLENGGRFLKKDFERKDDDDYWYLASFHDAREKISHAFRNYCPTTTTTRRSNETKTTKSFSSSTTSTMDADNNFLSAVTGLCSLSQNVKG